MVSIRSQKNLETAAWNVEGIEASVSTSCKQTYQPQHVFTYSYLMGKLIFPQSLPVIHWLYHFQYLFLGYRRLQRFLSVSCLALSIPIYLGILLPFSWTASLWLIVSLRKDTETIANPSSLCYQWPPWVHRGVLSNSLTSWQVPSILTNYLAFLFSS